MVHNVVPASANDAVYKSRRNVAVGADAITPHADRSWTFRIKTLHYFSSRGYHSLVHCQFSVVSRRQQAFLHPRFEVRRPQTTIPVLRGRHSCAIFFPIRELFVRLAVLTSNSLRIAASKLNFAPPRPDVWSRGIRQRTRSSIG